MKIGLVLSGALSKGAYQVGFLEALLKHISIDDIKIISGTSLGFINAYALSSGKLNLLKKLYLNVDASNKFKLLKKIWFDKWLKKSLNELVKEEDKLKIPIYCSITRLPFLSIRYYRMQSKIQQKDIKICKAAINNPLFGFMFGLVDNSFSIDGGVLDNIPLYPLIYHKNSKKSVKEMADYDLDLILVLHFDAHYDYRKYYQPTNTIIIDLDISYKNNFEKKHYDFSENNIEKMFNSGFDYGDEISSFLFSKGYENKEILKQRADEIFLKEHNLRMKSNSIDTYLRVLNDIGSFLRNEKKCINLNNRRENLFIPKTKYVYPTKKDEHMIYVKKKKNIILDKNYKYLDNSFKFKFKRFWFNILFFCLACPIARLRYMLKVKGKQNLKKSKKLYGNSLITISNHVCMWDLILLRSVVHLGELHFPIWNKNMEASISNLYRYAGGIPVPKDISAFKKFNKAINNVLEDGKWLHVYPEQSMWYYFVPIRDFKKGSFYYAYKHNKPILPIGYSYRKPNKFFKFLGKKEPFITMNIGKPLFPNYNLSMKKSIEELKELSRLEMMKLCDINYLDNNKIADKKYIYEDGHLYTDM